MGISNHVHKIFIYHYIPIVITKFVDAQNMVEGLGIMMEEKMREKAKKKAIVEETEVGLSEEQKEWIVEVGHMDSIVLLSAKAAPHELKC